jgi:hypothetical protein
VSAIIGIEIAAMIAVLIAFTDPIVRIGAALIAGAMVYLAYQLRLHASHVSAARTDVARTTESSAEFTLHYLEARRAFHSGIRFWSRLVVLLPGVPVMVYGLAHGELGAVPLGILVAFAAMMVLATVVQRRVARGYQMQIDDLRRLQGEM